MSPYGVNWGHLVLIIGHNQKLRMWYWISANCCRLGTAGSEKGHAYHQADVAHHRVYILERMIRQIIFLDYIELLKWPKQAKSMRQYFDSKCNEVHGNKPRKFWDAIKPFVSVKSKNNNECNMLNINGTVWNDSDAISQEFSNHFCNIVKDICKEPPLMYNECLQDVFSKYDNHESIVSIKRKIYPKTSSILVKLMKMPF